MTETSTLETFVDTPTWGAISWRKTHRLDTAEDQIVGWKVMGTFIKPQFHRDVERYVALNSSPDDWVCPYQFEVVPFEEQDEVRARKLAELTGNPVQLNTCPACGSKTYGPKCPPCSGVLQRGD